MFLNNWTKNRDAMWSEVKDEIEIEAKSWLDRDGDFEPYNHYDDLTEYWEYMTQPKNRKK